MLPAVVLATGCGPPQEKPANYRPIESLRTALPAHIGDWLEDDVPKK